MKPVIFLQYNESPVAFYIKEPITLDSIAVNVEHYFAEKAIQDQIRNFFCIVAFHQDANFVTTEAFLRSIVLSPCYSEALDIAKHSMTELLYCHIIKHTNASDLWWETIQALLVHFNAPTIERAMFIGGDDNTISDDIVIVLPDLSSITTTRTALFDHCKSGISANSIEVVLQSFANHYVNANLDSLIEFWQRSDCSDVSGLPLGQFLAQVHRCAADAIYCAIADLSDGVCDPLKEFRSNH